MLWWIYNAFEWAIYGYGEKATVKLSQTFICAPTYALRKAIEAVRNGSEHSAELGRQFGLLYKTK